MGVEFLPICDVLFNVVSLASYFCDVVFGAIATYTFLKSDLRVCFWLGLVSIISSLVTCQAISARWMASQERHRNMSRRRLAVLTTLHCLGGGMVWRYSLLFAPIQLEHVKQEMRNLCVLRMIHGFAESMTLLLIQTYVACTVAESVKEINVISMALSLFNVCWALASFTKNIQQHNVHRLVLTWVGVIFQFMWRLGTVTSRVLVLVLYSTVYTHWVFLVVALHWVSMMLWVLSRYAAFKAERLTKIQKVVLSVFVSYVHIFCYVNLEEQNTKLKIVTFYSIMLVENILLIALWTLGEQYSPTGLADWDRDKIFIAVFCSFFLGLVFMLIYYRYFHVRKLAAALNFNAETLGRKTTERKTTQSPTSSDYDPAVTVFNCALNPALRKKKKMPSRSAPPLPGPGGTKGPLVPFWKEPLPEERTAGDGLSYSRTTSVDDIRQKLQEKKEKQILELRRIEDDIAAGRIERPPSLVHESDTGFGPPPVPGVKIQPQTGPGEGARWPGDQMYHGQGDQVYHGQEHCYQQIREQDHLYLRRGGLADYNSELDTSGRYRSYKDSSGDQGDIDSGDDPHDHPVPPLHPRHRFLPSTVRQHPDPQYTFPASPPPIHGPPYGLPPSYHGPHSQPSHHGPQTSHHGPQTSHHGPQTSHHGPQPSHHGPQPIHHGSQPSHYDPQPPPDVPWSPPHRPARERVVIGGYSHETPL